MRDSERGQRARERSGQREREWERRELGGKGTATAGSVNIPSREKEKWRERKNLWSICVDSDAQKWLTLKER